MKIGVGCSDYPGNRIIESDTISCMIASGSLHYSTPGYESGWVHVLVDTYEEYNGG